MTKAASDGSLRKAQSRGTTTGVAAAAVRSNTSSPGTGGSSTRRSAVAARVRRWLVRPAAAAVGDGGRVARGDDRCGPARSTTTPPHVPRPGLRRCRASPQRPARGSSPRRAATGGEGHTWSPATERPGGAERPRASGSLPLGREPRRASGGSWPPGPRRADVPTGVGQAGSPESGVRRLQEQDPTDRGWSSRECRLAHTPRQAGACTRPGATTRSSQPATDGSVPCVR